MTADNYRLSSLGGSPRGRRRGRRAPHLNPGGRAAGVNNSSKKRRGDRGSRRGPPFGLQEPQLVGEGVSNFHMPVGKDQDLSDGLRHGDPVQLGELPAAEQGLHPGAAQGRGLVCLGELLQLGADRPLLPLVVLPVAEVVLPAEQAVLVVLVGFALTTPKRTNLSGRLLSIGKYWRILWNVRRSAMSNSFTKSCR